MVNMEHHIYQPSPKTGRILEGSVYSLDRKCQLPGASGTIRQLIGIGCEHAFDRLLRNT